MRGNPGTIVTWKSKDGETCYGFAYDKDQSPTFRGRIFIHQIESLDNPVPKLIGGKKVIAVKFPKDLKACGKVD